MIWKQPPLALHLPDDKIHLWKENLDVSSDCRQAYFDLLNPTERERAARYRFEEPRNRFVVTRAILRRLIGRYTHLSPDKIVFDTNTWGKPMLAECMDSHMEFNVAHSKDLALYAFASNRSVGVDVEYVHPIENVDHLVANFFSDYELQVFKQIPEELRLQAFFNGWTRKEAYIKGRGKGLSIPLNSFDVTLEPGESVALLEDRTNETEAQRWQLLDIKPGNGYTAALAVEGSVNAFDVLCYSMSDETDYWSPNQ